MEACPSCEGEEEGSGQDDEEVGREGEDRGIYDGEEEGVGPSQAEDDDHSRSHNHKLAMEAAVVLDDDRWIDDCSQLSVCLAGNARAPLSSRHPLVYLGEFVSLVKTH